MDARGRGGRGRGGRGRGRGVVAGQVVQSAIHARIEAAKAGSTARRINHGALRIQVLQGKGPSARNGVLARMKEARRNSEGIRAPPALSSACSLVGLAAIAHLGWGWHPALARFLELRARVPPLQLMFMTNVVSSVALGVGWVVRELHARYRGTTRFDPLAPHAPALWSSCEVGRRKLRLALQLMAMSVCRSALNVESTALAFAWLVQLIQLLTPALTALGSCALLGECMPRRIWPMLLVASAGCTLIIMGGHGDSNSALGWEQLWGALLQLASVCFLAGFQVMVRGTAGVLTRAEQMFVIKVGSTLMMLILTLGFESHLRAEDAARLFGVWASLTPAHWGAFVSFSLGIFVLADFAQLVAIRSIGASYASCFQPLRIVSSTAGSYLLLHEPVDSALQWVGVTLVLVATTVWVTLSHRDTLIAARMAGGAANPKRVNDKQRFRIGSDVEEDHEVGGDHYSGRSCRTLTVDEENPKNPKAYISNRPGRSERAVTIGTYLVDTVDAEFTQADSFVFRQSSIRSLDTEGKERKFSANTPAPPPPGGGPPRRKFSESTPAPPPPGGPPPKPGFGSTAKDGSTPPRTVQAINADDRGTKLMAGSFAMKLMKQTAMMAEEEEEKKRQRKERQQQAQQHSQPQSGVLVTSASSAADV